MKIICYTNAHHVLGTLVDANLAAVKSEHGEYGYLRNSFKASEIVGKELTICDQENQHRVFFQKNLIYVDLLSAESKEQAFHEGLMMGIVKRTKFDKGKWYYTIELTAA